MADLVFLSYGVEGKNADFTRRLRAYRKGRPLRYGNSEGLGRNQLGRVMGGSDAKTAKNIGI